MNKINIKKEDWPKLILAIRGKLNYSQQELANYLKLNRSTIQRWEQRDTFPKNYKPIIELIKNKNLNFSELIINKQLSFSKDTRKPKLQIKRTILFAEFIGIILGDGEINNDGIRISFDPKKDKNFLYRRIFPMVWDILNKEVCFESYKRIAVYCRQFRRYLEDECQLKSGSKFNNNSRFPKWCRDNYEFIAAVLRGMFDTDGYFGYSKGSLELMFGRFSAKSTFLVADIKQSLERLGMNPTILVCNDGQYKVRLSSKKDILIFLIKLDHPISEIL